MLHAIWIKLSSYRNVGPDGQQVKQFRQFEVLAPKPGSSLTEYVAELEQSSPANARKVLQAIRVGLPLVGQKKLWDDTTPSSGKISETKAMTYVLNHFLDAEFQTLLVAGKKAEAIDLAKVRLGAAEPPAPVAATVTADAAAETEKVAKALWNESEEKYDAWLKASDHSVAVA